jgi:hypothetical protein
MDSRQAGFYSTAKFSIAILKANFKNWKMLMFSLGFPLFMLLSIWLPSIGATGEDAAWSV